METAIDGSLVRYYVIAAAAVLLSVGFVVLTLSWARPHIQRNALLYALFAGMSTALMARSLSEVSVPSALWFVGILAAGAAVGVWRIRKDLAARIRLALEERRDPELANRRKIVSQYEEVLGALTRAQAREKSGHYLVVVAFLMKLDDATITLLAAYLNVKHCEGRAETSAFERFLKEERDIVGASPLQACGHLHRLTTVVERNLYAY